MLLWAAGIAHWVGGNVDFGLAGNILIGSVPGVLVGGRLAFKSGKNLLRGLLSRRPDRLRHHPDREGRRQPSVVITAAFVSLIFGVVFTYILRREVKLPHGEGVRAWKLVSFPWSRPDHVKQMAEHERERPTERPRRRSPGARRADKPDEPDVANLRSIGSAGMDFSLGDRLEELLGRVRGFMDEHVYPVEAEAMQALDDEVQPGRRLPGDHRRDPREGPRARASGTSSCPTRSTAPG